MTVTLESNYTPAYNEASGEKLRQMFWEQFKELGIAFRVIWGETMTNEEKLLKASEPVIVILSRIQRGKGGAAKRLRI